MHVSSSPHYQRYKFKRGYITTEANNAAQLKNIAKKDWCPGVFNGDQVSYRSWDHCDWLYFDVDNVPGKPQQTIKELFATFADYEFYVITSRNHLKEKQERDKNDELTGVIYPAADRYHVLFPQTSPITNGDSLDRMLSIVIEKYPFFDSDAKGRNRFFFGFDQNEVHYHEGKPFTVVLANYPLPEKKTKGRPVTTAAPIAQLTAVDPALMELQGQEDGSRLSEIPIDREMLFAALDIANERGVFDDRHEWVKLGATLYVAGYDYEDWMRFSHPGEDTPENLARWNGFHSTTKLSAGSLFYFIREHVDPLFMTPGAPAKSIVKDRLLANIKKEVEQSAQPPAIVPKNQANVPATLFRIRRPTKVEEPPQALVEKVAKAITYVDEEGKVCTKPDWFTIVFELDPAIQNCRFYDYTMGIPSIAYANTTLLKTSITQRLCYYVPIKKAMNQEIVNLLIDYAQKKNQYHNRVAAFVDEVQERFPNPRADVLDRFMQVFTFTPDSSGTLTQEQLKKLYREVWHLFFLRMHCHIDGTRMNEEQTSTKFLMENDIVPVLRGDQNQGKTTLCKWLAGDFTGSGLYAELGSGSKMSGFGGHDTIKEVRGKMIAELGEMRIMRSAQDVETVKSFISKKRFAVDVKFVEFTDELPVTVSYIGTSNAREFLNDPSGNRRFFPIDLAGIDVKFLAENEALCLELHSYYAQLAQKIPIDERLGACRVGPELLAFMTKAREEATVKGDDYNLVVDLVSNAFRLRRQERSPHDTKTKFHTITGFQIQKMATDAGYHIRIGANTVQGAMQEMGYVHSKIKQHGAVVTGWKRALDEPFRGDTGGGLGFGDGSGGVNADG